jgi:NitT/TauT family transport system permease protein
MLKVPEYVLPAPHKVILDLVENYNFIFLQTGYTYGAALSGFLLGLGIAFLLAVYLSTSSLAERAVFPLLIASQAIPVMAFSVILVAIFGNGWMTEVIIAVYLVFVPITVNWVRGLKSSDPDAVAMMQSLGASRRDIFWKLRFYDSLPFAFSAAKVCAVVAMAGAIVGEFMGAPKGIGTMLLRAIYYQNTVRLWTVIAVCAVLGSGSYYVLSFAERRVLWWIFTPPEAGPTSRDSAEGRADEANLPEANPKHSPEPRTTEHVS